MSGTYPDLAAEIIFLTPSLMVLDHLHCRDSGLRGCLLSSRYEHCGWGLQARQKSLSVSSSWSNPSSLPGSFSFPPIVSHWAEPGLMDIYTLTKVPNCWTITSLPERLESKHHQYPILGQLPCPSLSIKNKQLFWWRKGKSRWACYIRGTKSIKAVIQ